MIGEGEAIIDRYLMWEYHGSLECEEISALLRAMGQDEKAKEFDAKNDDFEEYRVIIYFCEDEVLRSRPLTRSTAARRFTRSGTSRRARPRSSAAAFPS
jgi:hypothetical protein